MDRGALADELFAALDALACSYALTLIDVEVKGSGGRPTVAVYLDCDGGIGIDALAKANHWISSVLDERIGTSYTLEVSSPGGRARKEKI